MIRILILSYNVAMVVVNIVIIMLTIADSKTVAAVYFLNFYDNKHQPIASPFI